MFYNQIKECIYDLFDCAAVFREIRKRFLKHSFLHGFSNTFLTLVQKKCKKYVKTLLVLCVLANILRFQRFVQCKK